MRKPDRMAGLISGRMTLKNACRGSQPRSSAASNSLMSNCLSLGVTLKMTYGTLNAIWAMSSVGKPMMLSGRKSSSDAKRWYATKSIIREIPVMISGLTVVI